MLDLLNIVVFVPGDIGALFELHHITYSGGLLFIVDKIVISRFLVSSVLAVPSLPPGSDSYCFGDQASLYYQSLDLPSPLGELLILSEGS